MSNGNLSRTGKPDISILQHWSAEGVDPLRDVIEQFERRNGGVTFENQSEPVSTLRLIVKGKVLREDPPDLWVEWPGKNISLSVDAGVVADISDVWADENLTSDFVEGARDAARFDGRFHCLPTDIYRINNLFYNVSLVEGAGVDVERLSTPDDFLEALRTLDDALDVPPMVLNGKDPFGSLQLWETLLIAYGDAETYRAMLDGRADRHRDTIRRAVETLDRMLSFTTEDVGFVSSEAADEQFIEGGGALAHNGGWALGRFKDAPGFEYGTDWECVPFPGTGRSYQMNMNAIVPAKHVEEDENVKNFLRHVASRDSIATINDALGSVPPRTDVRSDDLHPVTREHQRALETTGSHLPSMTHGLGVTPKRVIDLKDSITTFLQTRDVSATTEAMVAALTTERSA